MFAIFKAIYKATFFSVANKSVHAISIILGISSFIIIINYFAIKVGNINGLHQRTIACIQQSRRLCTISFSQRHTVKAPRSLQQLLQGATGDAGSEIPQS